MHPDDWVPGLVKFDGVDLVQNGAINEGQSVRASWPFAYYATGHSLEIKDLHVNTNLPKSFTSNGKSGRRSHGGLFVGPAAELSSLPDVDPSAPNAHEWAGHTFYWSGGFKSGDSFQTYFETPSLLVINLDIEVTASDREEVHLRNVVAVTLIRPSIIEHGGQADIFVTDDCGSLSIIDPQTDMVVTITSAMNPHKGYGLPTYQVEAGTDFYWEN
jgi:hypothetical protein